MEYLLSFLPKDDSSNNGGVFLPLICVSKKLSGNGVHLPLLDSETGALT